MVIQLFTRVTNSFVDFIENCSDLEKSQDMHIEYEVLLDLYAIYYRKNYVKPSQRRDCLTFTTEDFRPIVQNYFHVTKTGVVIGIGCKFHVFIKTCPLLERRKDGWIPYSELALLYRTYCNKNHIQPLKKLSGDNFVQLCKGEGLIFSEDEDFWIPYRNKSTNKVVHGIRFKDGREPGTNVYTALTE